jgi:hydrogenase large subunit
MSNRVVVDPITRIEGHLRIEAQMQGDRIEKAYSSGTMVRGIEIIMRGRDPRDAWAFTQRICGVCTLVHGMASIRAVEDALKYEIPPNAQLIRNLMIGAQYVHDHVMHFYHLHALDWVDVVSALSADAAATAELAKAVSPSWPKSSEGYFRDVKKKLQTFVEGGQLGIFANAYWGHPAYKLPAEANLMAVAHYLEALAWQRDAAKLHTIFGGRNPHPNFVVGGVPCPIDLNSDSAINAERLSMVQNIITMMRTFVDQVYVPDTLAIAGFYKDWFTRGEGLGNFLSFGDMPSKTVNDLDSFLFPRGVVLNRDIGRVHEIDLADPEGIQEFASHSWYEYSGGKDQGLHPWEGETKFDYAGRGGPQPPTSSSTLRTATAGSSRRAGRAIPWRSARSPASWSTMPAATSRRASWSTTRCGPWTPRSKPCSPPWAGPRRGRSRPRSWRMRCRAGSTSSRRTFAAATPRLSTRSSGILRAGRRPPRASASMRRRAAV